MSSEEQHTPPVQAEVDETSILGHPNYVSPAEFAQQLSPATNLSHEGPEERVSAISYDAIAEQQQAIKEGEGALYGGIGMAACLSARVLIDKMAPAVDNRAIGDAIQTIGDHASALTMILCGVVMISSTARTEIHRWRARRAQANFEQTLKPDTQ